MFFFGRVKFSFNVTFSQFSSTTQFIINVERVIGMLIKRPQVIQRVMLNFN